MPKPISLYSGTSTEPCPPPPIYDGSAKSSKISTSIYPEALDGTCQLPIAIDGVTKINAHSVNTLRSAIVNIEKELGITPSGIYSTVRARLDALEMGSISPIIQRINELEAAIESLEYTLGSSYSGSFSNLGERLDFYESMLPDEPLNLEAGQDLLKGNLLRITNLGKIRLATAQVGSNELQYIKDGIVVGSVSKRYSDGEMARVYAMAGTLINVRFNELEIPNSTNNGSLVYLSKVHGEGTLIRPDEPGCLVFIVGILQGANGSNIAPKVVFQPKLEYFIS